MDEDEDVPVIKEKREYLNTVSSLENIFHIKCQFKEFAESYTVERIIGE